MTIKDFIQFLTKTKKMSNSSVEAYSRDVLDFEKFCLQKSISKLENVDKTVVAEYIMKLKDDGKSSSTINRKIASIRAFYKYLASQSKINENPTIGIKPPKLQKKDLQYLTIWEVEALLETPDDSAKGKRDKAILEMLYATGMRVNELVEANLDDVNLRIGFFKCTGQAGKARIVPIGMIARKAVSEYIETSREQFISGNKKENALFVNYRGERMTRQGLWKILKSYGDKANLGAKITPHILRTSFAVHMVQNGADLKSLQELMGHEDITAIQVYMSMSKNRIKDVYDRTHPRA